MDLSRKLPYRLRPIFNSMENFVVLRKVGEGGTAIVSECRDKATGTVYAVKQMDLSKIGQNPAETWDKELLIHKRLNHPHIVKLVDYFLDKDSLCMVLENCSRGTLLRYMSRRTLELYPVIKLFRQTCMAIAYMHSQRVLMRDIKPENILLDEQSNVKLCDFGWSAFEGDADECRLKAGTFEYMSPETLKKEPQSFPADIWALGVLLYEMLTGNEPFVALTPVGMLNLMARSTANLSVIKSEEAKDLLKRMLQYEPAKRPTIKEVLADKLFCPLFQTGYLDDGPRYEPNTEESQQILTPVSLPPIFQRTQSGTLKEPPLALNIGHLKDKVPESMVHSSSVRIISNTNQPFDSSREALSISNSKPALLTVQTPKTDLKLPKTAPPVFQNRTTKAATYATNTLAPNEGLTLSGSKPDTRQHNGSSTFAQSGNDSLGVHPDSQTDHKRTNSGLQFAPAKAFPNGLIDEQVTEVSAGPQPVNSASFNPSPTNLVNIYSKRMNHDSKALQPTDKFNLYSDFRRVEATPSPLQPIPKEALVQTEKEFKQAHQDHRLATSVTKRSAAREEHLISVKTASASPNPTRKLFRLDAETNRYVNALFSEL